MAYQLSYICKILTIKLFYGRSNESRLPIEMPWGTFQSTHPRGVWPRWLGRETSLRSFNPRTYERCDYKLLDAVKDWNDVSIHAPTRGATTIRLTSGSTNLFQSTHLREVRRTKTADDAAYDTFQSTHLREVRHPLRVALNTLLVSIHAPTRGATKRTT